MSIKRFFRKLFLSQVEKEEGDFRSYMDNLKAGNFRDVLNYGVAEDKRGFLLKNPVDQPGALYCGGMGSGKSVAMRFTLSTHFIANSDITFYLLIDTQKGMTDYAPLFDYDQNVATAINDKSKLVPAFEMIYLEMMARKEEFSRLQANNILTYERLRREGVKDADGKWIQKPDPSYKGMARIIIGIEEFHDVPNNEIVKYHLNSDRENSTAYQLKQILRIGRSYGITMLAATQRATADDFPSSLKPGITQQMSFKVNNPGDAAAINLPLAVDIKGDQRGRCVYENGFIQFPYLNDKDLKKLLKDYYKPLTAELLKYKVKDYQTALTGEGNDGMVEVKTLTSLLENWQAFNYSAIMRRFLRYFDFKVEFQTNKALGVNLIAERDGIKYAVLTMTNPREQGSDKSIAVFKKGLELLGCQQAIVINNENMPSSAANKVVESLGGYYVDKEDLQRIASVIDNRDKLEKENKYEELFNTLALMRKEAKEVKEVKKTEEKKSEEEDIFAAIDAATKTIAPKATATEKEPEIKRPQSPTGGSDKLMELRERLKMSLRNPQD